MNNYTEGFQLYFLTYKHREKRNDRKIETRTTQTCVIERLLFSLHSRTLRNRFSKINLIITYFFGGLQKNDVYLHVE